MCVCVCVCARACVRVCARVSVRARACMCMCARALAHVCRARSKPRGLNGIDTYRRTQTYLKIVIGKIQTHTLHLHTLRMRTLEMVKTHKHLNDNKKEAEKSLLWG